MGTERYFTNYQEVRVQESAQCLSLGGAMPHAVAVLLQDELAGSCQVGGAGRWQHRRGCKPMILLRLQQLPLDHETSATIRLLWLHMGSPAMPSHAMPILWPARPPACLAEDVEVTGVVIRQFGRMTPGERCHVGLAVEASSLCKVALRNGATEVSPETYAMFQQFWDAHRGCPMLGRRWVGGRGQGSVAEVEDCWGLRGAWLV